MTGVIKRLLATSLVFRLWISLSLLGALFSGVALVTFVLLSVNDDVEAAHKAIQGRSLVVIASLSGITRDPAQANNNYATVGRSVGMRALELVSPQGRTFGPSIAGAATSAEPSIEQTLTSRALKGEQVQRRVVLDKGQYKGSAISPLDVIRGGTFGEEFFYPITDESVPGAAVAHFVLEYPDVSSQASTLIGRIAWAAFVIMSTSLIGMWVFLRIFISKPLRRYSALAMRIASGERTRMPATGHDELAELGRALNGMADVLNHQATVDSLTGLYNLRHLSSNLESLIAEAKHHGKPLSLLVGDLDNLKPVNDTFGHSAGDKLLQAVSDTLRAWAGNEFTCWRLGGDEFVVALPGVGGEEALGHAANLRGRIASIQLPAGGAQMRASISVGVATYPADGESAGSLLNAADRRMYALKALRAEERRIAANRLAAA